MTTSFTLVSPSTVTARVAGALFGLELGYNDLQGYSSLLGASSTSSNAFLNWLYQASVGSTSTSLVADVIVENLGLTGTAAVNGKAELVAQLNNATVATRGQVIVDVLNTFSNLTTDPVYGSFATAFNTKITNALAYGSIEGNGTTTFSSVSTSASTVGTTFTLTTGIDSKTGTSGNDIFNAALSNGYQTLNSLDSIVGGAGSDTLSAEIISNVTPASLSGIENVAFTFEGTSASTVSLANASSVTSVSVNASTQVGTVSNIAGNAALNVQDQSSNVTFAYASSAVSGTADSASLSLSNVTGGTLTLASVETINLTSSGAANAATLVAANATTINVAGGQDLTLGLTAASVNKIDASSATGALTVTGNDIASTILGGAGNDVLTLGTAADSVSAGNGNDTLYIGSRAQLLIDTISGGSGTDTISLAAAAQAVSDSDFTLVSSIEKLTITGTGQDTLTIGTAAWAEGLVTVTGSTGVDAITVTSANAFYIKGNGGTDTLTLQSAASTVTIDDIDVVTAGTFNDSVTLGGTSVAAATTIDLGAGSDTLTISNTNGVTVTTTNVETISAGAGNDTITLQAAAGTGGVYVNAGDGVNTITSGSGTDTIISGSGNDIINFTVGAADSISSGAGNDTISAAFSMLTGGTTVNGGDGTDTIVVTGDAVSLADANFSKVSYVEKLTISGTGGDALVLGTAAWAAGIVTVTGSTGIDAITVTSANAFYIKGGAGTDTLTLQSAASTVTIDDIDVVTAGTFNDSVTLGGTSVAAATTIDLGAGSDTLTISNTNGVTVSTTNVETITGGEGNDTVTLLGGATFVDLGAGTADAVTLSVANGTATLANVETVTGSTGVDSVTFSGAASATVSAVETVYADSTNATSDTINDVLVLGGVTAGVGTFAYTAQTADLLDTGAGNDTITITLSNVAGSAANTAANLVLTVYGGAGNDTVTISNSIAASAGTSTLYLDSGAGSDTISLGGSNATNQIDVVRVNLSTDLSADTTLANHDRITGFTASDYIDLAGALKNGAGADLALHVTTGAGGTSNSDNSSFAVYSDTTANLANLNGNATKQNAYIFLDTSTITADFTTQAGIDTAVTTITGSIGTAGSVTGQKVVLVLKDNVGDNAVFLYTEAGTTGISSSELTLVGVTTGADLTAATTYFI